MKKIALFIIIPFILSAQIRFLPVGADYASFYSSDTAAYLEIYVSLFQGNLQYNRTDDNHYMASFSNQVELLKNGEVFKTYSHIYQNTTQDTMASARYNQFVDIFKVEVPYGDYQARVEVTDKNSNIKGQYELDIKTVSPVDGISLSDIEFCSEIVRDTTRNMFFKNNLKIVPNPRRVYDIIRPLLYFYVEVSNLPFTPGTENLYEFEYFITSSKGDTLKRKKPVKKKVIGNTLVEAGGMNVMALPKDIYFLNIRAKDLSTGEEAQTRRKFYVYKPTSKEEAVKQTEMPAVAEVYNDFTKEELLLEFSMARYIATRTEEQVFENLENENAMKKYLTEFWNRRDKAADVTPGLSRNNFLRNTEYANQHFGFLGKDGWKSDRGRVILMYGQPDEFERFPNSMDLLPYVTWYYLNLEGGAQFIFADLDGFGEYQLIHSTYRKELQNPNWQSLIRKGGGSVFDRDF